MHSNQVWLFTDSEKALVTSFVKKGRREERKNKQFAIIDFNDLYKLFNNDEIVVIKKFLTINPKKVGHKLPYLGAGEIPTDLIPVDNQAFIKNEQKTIIPRQYLPRNVYDSYHRLNEAIEADIKQTLLVSYGYRSPARQVFMFFDILERVYNFDFIKTLERVCFPDYSEHVCVNKQAIDFKTQRGTKSEDFDKTAEYAWLRKNASRFNFFESYPKNNHFGMMYEPWHWHHEV